MRYSSVSQASFAVLLLASTMPAMAQAPAPQGPRSEPETVYSDAQHEKDLAASRQTVETMLASAFSIENQYAKWKVPVCARVFGLAAADAWFLEHRIREVAATVGAPVDGADSCRPNIAIFLSDEPQTILDAIAAARPFLVAGGNQKVLVKYPAQAWYASLKTDFNGVKTFDVPFDVSNPSADCIMSMTTTAALDNGDIMGAPAADQAVGFCEMPFVRANDSRLHIGLTAEMAATTVLVDNKTVMGMTLGEIGDYLAFLTLAQAQQTGRCQPLPTIANLVVKNCAAGDTPHALSHIDIALLTALYEVPDSPEVLQKQRIVSAMRRELEAQFGKD